MMNSLRTSLLVMVGIAIACSAFAVPAPSVRDPGENFWMERLNDDETGWSWFDIRWNDTLTKSMVAMPFYMRMYDFTGVYTGNVPAVFQQNAAPKREAWMYCVDERPIVDPDWYRDAKGELPNPNIAPVTQLAWSRKVYLIDKYGPSSVLDSVKGSAMQLAIWELINETTGTLNVSAGKGSFFIFGGSLSYWSSSVALANTWLNEVSALTFPEGYGSWDQAWVARNVSAGMSESGQNFNEVPIPEPAPIVALAAGLLPLLASFRRRT